MFLQEQGWLMNIIRMLLACIDYVVFSLIKWVLYLIFDLSQLSANSEVLNAIYKRTYIVLAVFMAFKLSFSFFKYVVNPDAMVDKKQGVGKLLQNVIIMLAALITLPNLLFGSDNHQGLLVRAQNAFLPMLPRIILGINTGDDAKGANAKSTTIDTAADNMAAQIMIAFFTPKRDELAKKCKNYKDSDIPEIESISQLTSLVNTSCETNEARTQILGITITTARYYYYSYTFIASTICGIIILAILIGMLIDVAKRVFKMIILQVIAPIPIMSLIDPDAYQKGAFGAWMHQLINTYLEIFLKIGVLYIVIMLIQLITTKGLFGKDQFPEFSEQPIRSAFLVVALIIGLFQFAKEAPKFIKDSLGIKEKGDGGGNMGKIARVAGGAVAGAAGGAMQGDMRAGAVQGGTAAASAKPGESAKAFRAGSDRAAQLRTGDDKYKTGFAASMQRRAGAAAGYSTQGYQQVANRTKADAAAAKTAESDANKAKTMANVANDDYDSFTKSGLSYNDWYDSQDAATQQRLNSNGLSKTYVASAAASGSSAANEMSKYVRTKNNTATAKASAAATAKKKAESSEKKQKEYESGMSRYGVSKKETGGVAGAGYRASRAVSNGAHTAGRAVVNAAERVPGLGAAVRTADSAHQQHMLNEMANGTRGDNAEFDRTTGTYRDESEVRTDARHDLDNTRGGTLQSATKRGMDAIHPGIDHDGHFGHGGSSDGSNIAGGGSTHH